ARAYSTGPQIHRNTSGFTSRVSGLNRLPRFLPGVAAGGRVASRSRLGLGRMLMAGLNLLTQPLKHMRRRSGNNRERFTSAVTSLIAYILSVDWVIAQWRWSPATHAGGRHPPTPIAFTHLIGALQCPRPKGVNLVNPTHSVGRSNAARTGTTACS